MISDQLKNCHRMREHSKNWNAVKLQNLYSAVTLFPND